MGEDYQKYLEDHGVTEKDPFDVVFGNNDEPQPELPAPEAPEVTLESLLGGGFQDDEFKRDKDGKFASQNSSGSRGGEKDINVFSELADAEDNGGKDAAFEKASEIVSSDPSRMQEVSQTLSDLGYDPSQAGLTPSQENEGDKSSKENDPGSEEENEDFDFDYSTESYEKSTTDVFEAEKVEPVNPITDQEKFESIKSQMEKSGKWEGRPVIVYSSANGICLLYTSDAADE